MADERDQDRNRDKKPRAKDVMHGRNFAGTNWAADEETQTRAKNRPDESDEFVTDAELEAREANGEIGGGGSGSGDRGIVVAAPPPRPTPTRDPQPALYR